MVRTAGTSKKKPGQRHQNTFAFIPKENVTQVEMIKTLPNTGVCQRCHDIIEWKKKYGKYKPLKQATKCTGCSEKRVDKAYHMLCKQCAKSRNVCAKCGASHQIVNSGFDAEEQADQKRKEMEAEADLEAMTERARRTAKRQMEKEEQKQKEAENMEDDEDGAEDRQIELGQDNGEEDDDNSVQQTIKDSDASLPGTSKANPRRLNNKNYGKFKPQ